jgi:hypothetical protein
MENVVESHLMRAPSTLQAHVAVPPVALPLNFNII